MKFNAIFLFVIYIFYGINSNAQNTIRGMAIEEFNETPIPNATVLLSGNNLKEVESTDSLGRFRFNNIIPGRYSVSVQIIGFNSVKREIILTSAKEEVIFFTMRENIIELEGISITPQHNHVNTKNDWVMVSGRGFSIDDTRRFAGSLNDPSRMAANFAGVGSANDMRNDIVIRGNSPSGLLWRMEGIDIPNPNHFAAMGTTGGPINLLNINLLGYSDFITGAFPAEYGNALSGVFDLSMRKGNNEKREYTFQLGFNGVELGAEGPIGRKDGSYLINYRYSTVELINALGVDIGVGSAVPKFQDISFNVDLPSGKYGKIRVFGMGGKSNIKFISERPENTDRPTRNTYSGSKSGVLGVSHKLILPGNWVSNLTLATTHSSQYTREDSLIWNPKTKYPVFGELLNENKYIAHFSFDKKINVKNYLKLGSITTNIAFNLQDSLFIKNSFIDRITSKGQTQTHQIYGQWKYNLHENLSGSFGLHSMYLRLNGHFQLEPRAAMSWQLAPGHAIQAGYGRHSQIQPINLMFFKDPSGNFPDVSTNSNLGFSRSEHLVLGYTLQKHDPWNFKTEIYIQKLSNIPVQIGSSFSMINAGADFGIPAMEGLTNDGLGKNVGVDFTAERNFERGYYLLFTTSIYDSRYRDFGGVWHNTAFNGNFVQNLLYGKEYSLKNNQVLSFDFNVTWAGGRRLTPIDLEKSKENARMVFDDQNPFSQQLDNFFRMDTRITYRINGKKSMQEWALDIQNITNRRNIFMQQYDVFEEDIYNVFQIGIFPIIFYKVNF
jgi:hypothetical protein